MFSKRAQNLPLILAAAVFFACAASLVAQPKGPQPEIPYAPDFSPNQDEGIRALAQFRKLGIVGDYVLEFSLRVMPRRGEERLIHARMYGTRNELGPISRIELFEDPTKTPLRLLIQNGERASVWISENGGPAQSLGAARLFESIAATELSAFELQMPFLYWGAVEYKGVVRLRGRPAHEFVAKPPMDIAVVQPELAGVRFYLDTQFSALVQVERLSADEKITRSLTVLDLKRAQDQWLVKTIDLRDERSRNKTRFQVSAVALNVRLARDIFTAEKLASDAPVIPPESFERLR